MAKDNKNTLYCSFCGKSQHEVRKLIAGPTVFICDECVELCMDIIKEENKSNFVKDDDDELKKVVYEPVKLSQAYRDFDFESPWEGTKYIKKETDKR